MDIARRTLWFLAWAILASWMFPLLPPTAGASTLTIRLRDGNGTQPVAARVALDSPAGSPFAVPDSVLWTRQSAALGSYVHAEDSLRVDLSPGPVTLRAVRGLPGIPVELAFQVAGDTTVTLLLDTWLDAPAAGWWGGDPHVHSEHSQSQSAVYPPAPVDLSARVARAEGLETMALLDNDPSHPGGAVAPPEPGVALVWGEEYRTGFWGHVGLLDLPSLLLTNGGPGCCGASESGDPTISQRFASEPPLVAWLAHPHTTDDPYIADHWPGAGFARERAALALTGVVTGYAVAGGTNGMLSCWDVVGYLDGLRAGARWAAIGEGDRALDRFQSDPPGVLRTYAAVDPGWPLGSAGGADAWSASLVAGRTFATTGPFLYAFEVAGVSLGDSVAVTAGVGVPVRVALDSFAPIDTLRLHGATGIHWTGVWPGGVSSVDTTVGVVFSHDDFVVVEARAPAAGWATHPEGPRLISSPIQVRTGTSWPVSVEVARRGADANLAAWERVNDLRTFSSPAGSLAVATLLMDAAAAYEAMADDPPGPFGLRWPPDGATEPSTGVTFQWDPAIAYDGETTTYRVAVDDDDDLTDPDWHSAGSSTSLAVTGFEAGEVIWWRVEATEPGEPPVWSTDGPWSFQISGQPVSAPERGVALRVGPVRWRGGQADWRLELPTAGPIRVRWYDLRGRRVRTQEFGTREAGVHVLRWDGEDARGGRLAAGAYLGVLEAGAQRRILRTTRPGG